MESYVGIGSLEMNARYSSGATETHVTLTVRLSLERAFAQSTRHFYDKCLTATVDCVDNSAALILYYSSSTAR